MRAAVAPAFAVAVKLNSADFQRGGFDAADAATVIAVLAPLGVDVIELSGGSYEAAAMTGQASDERTRSREAYFLPLAEELATNSPLPLMLTGGIVRLPVAEEILTGTSMARVRQQLRRLGAGRRTRPGADPELALLAETLRRRRALRRYREWLKGRAA
ncbi:hypothetical protein [Nocardia sp. CA-290969]|uniref:hypothetical protein n=1 Tax=Nocardia sp. CA-290969 TaxID=3239986 RepID=UPI003D8F0D21